MQEGCIFIHADHSFQIDKYWLITHLNQEIPIIQ
jgi:hypothetical protein